MRSPSDYEKRIIAMVDSFTKTVARNFSRNLKRAKGNLEKHYSDEPVTLNTYTHLGLEDAVDELKRVEELENARKEMEKINGEGTVSQKMFRVI